MTFPGKAVTRVLKFTLQKHNVIRSQRISTLLISKPLSDLHSYRTPKVNSLFRKILKTERAHSVVCTQVRAMGALSPLDPSSYSRPELSIVKHVSLEWAVDFEKKVLSGVATLNIDVLDNITELILDTSKLNIDSVESDDGKCLEFSTGSYLPNFGSKLTVTLDKPAAVGAKWLIPERKCLHLPAAEDDINLKFTGFLYKPDIFTFLENAEKTCCVLPSRCVYYSTEERVLPFPSSANRIMSEGSLDKSERSEENTESIRKFGEDVLTERGEIYILGPNGTHHKVTTLDELRRVPSKCLKTQGMPAVTIDPGGMVTQTEKPKLPSTIPSFYVRHVMNDDYILAPRQQQADVCPERLRNVTIKIKYSTSSDASALQWMDPNQTSGKILPFMYSQCQPIHARSLFPCQDTPAVKFTYDAVVSAPPEFTVLMSALRGEVAGNTTSFRQPMPLPSYLVAIAVGEMESKYLGPRSRVWSEKESLAKSAWEFGDTERYLQAAERLCGQYQWTEYDLLVLPPSFPYGGMENPCLTFVTPSLLAGDKSLADVIVHEIMHSWTGNLVTNRNFEHFWLNEGFTVYLERKVTASLVQDPDEARRIRDFNSILGLQELNETVNTLGLESPLTLLVPDLSEVHPDDSFSRVPYEKGSLFLRYLEDLLGGAEVFDEFLRSYLNNYSRKSLDTTDFKAFLYKYFKGDTKLDSVDWETWLHKPGMPPIIPNYDTSMTKSVDCLVERIAKELTFSIRDVQDFSPQQMIYFLQKLVDGKPLPDYALRDMEKEYKLTENRNAEIRYRLVRLAIRSQDKTRLDEVFKFVNSLGRMKFVRPIYRDLYAWDFSRKLAIENFIKNEKYMMHVSAYTLRKDLHLSV